MQYPYRSIRGDWLLKASIRGEHRQAKAAQKKLVPTSDETRESIFFSPFLSYNAPEGLRQAPGLDIESHELARSQGQNKNPETER